MIVTMLILGSGAVWVIYTLKIAHIEHHPSVVVSMLKPVARYIVIPAFVLILYPIRRAIQAVRAAAPGGIDIAVLPASPGDTHAKQLAAALRDALTEVHLYGPSVLPGESAPQSFLTEIRSVGEQARTFWGGLAAALSLVSPRIIYRATCTIQRDKSRGQCGLTVEVSGFPRKDVSVTTIWGDTWPQVSHRAACDIAAYVLPGTRLARQPPWTSWHGIKLIPDLFYSFHEARHLARDGRLEESLRLFEKAIALDPLNPYIRIEQATVYDELGLWIDALSTYVDVTTLESWYDRPVWRRYRRTFANDLDLDLNLGLDRGSPRRFSRSPNGHAALQLARYRTISSLAASRRVARQWQHNGSLDGSDGEITERQRDASRIIGRLLPLLWPYAKLMLKAHGLADECEIEDKIKELLRTDCDLLRRVLQFAALDESAALERDYRWYHPRRWRRLSVNPVSIKLMPLWATLQYHYVERVQRGMEIGRFFERSLECDWKGRGGPWHSFVRCIFPDAGIRWLRRLDRQTGWRAKESCPTSRGKTSESTQWQWPPDPEGLAKLVSRYLGGRVPLRWLRSTGSENTQHILDQTTFAPKHGWQERYSAACTFALSIMTPELCMKDQIECAIRSEIPKAEFIMHRKLVFLAVDELSRAIVTADSQFAGLRSEWLRRGDHDLDQLRSTQEYVNVVERYLPGKSSVWRLPADPTLLTVSGHIARVLTEYALLRKEFWRDRGAPDPVDANVLEAEFEWWRSLREACQDYRDWRTRLRLIDHVRGSTPSPPNFNQAFTDEDWLFKIHWPPPAPKPIEPQETADQGRQRKTVDERAKDDVCGWLLLASALESAAKGIVKERNRKVTDLACILSEPEWIDQLLDDVVRELVAHDLPADDGPEFRRQSIAAWTAAADCIQGKKDINETRRQFARLRQSMKSMVPARTSSNT